MKTSKSVDFFTREGGAAPQMGFALLLRVWHAAFPSVSHSPVIGGKVTFYLSETT